MKKYVFVFLLVSFLSIVSFSSAFESKILGDYQDYVHTFDNYLSQIEKTGVISSVPSNKVENAVYTIITEFEPAAYYKWISMRSFQIPAGAVGNFTNVDMWYIAQSIYQRYKTNDEIENVALASFLVYAVDDLYGKSVSQTDFPYFATFNQAIFDLGAKIQNMAANITKNYLQKSIGGQGVVQGTYQYGDVNIKDIFISNLQKAYGGDIPKDMLDAINTYEFKIPAFQNVEMNQYFSDLVFQSLNQKTIDNAFSDFKVKIAQSCVGSIRNLKTFLSSGQSTAVAVKRTLDAFTSSLTVNELLSSNTVRNAVSRQFNDRIIKLEGALAHASATPLSPIEWRWLAYAIALIFCFFYKRNWLSYVMLAIVAFESLVLIFGIDPMLSRLDSTLYGFLIVTVAFLGFLSFSRITHVKNLFQIISMVSVGVLFILVLFVPIYSNLPATRMSKNENFLKSAYLGIYEGELYGQNGIVTYDLQNISSDLSALRSDPYNFTNQTISFYLSTIKKADALKGIVQYPKSIAINVDRSSPYFGFSNLDEVQNSINVVRDRAQAALDDIKVRIDAVNRNKMALSNTLNGIYAYAAPQLRENIQNNMKAQISSSNLTELSTSLVDTLNSANEIKERAPNIQFFQTVDSSRIFILISFLFLSVTFFRKHWMYRFLISIMTILGTAMIFYDKIIEIFVEYGFPTYSHALVKGESPNMFILILIIAISIFVASEALYTRFKSIKEGKKV